MFDSDYDEFMQEKECTAVTAYLPMLSSIVADDDGHIDMSTNPMTRCYMYHGDDTDEIGYSLESIRAVKKDQTKRI